jgi:hypothetical protein
MTLDLRDRLEAEGLRPSAWANGPGERYAEHRHDYDKVLVAESGSIVFHVPGGAIELRRGDRLDLPAGTPHAADVGPEGVTCLEAHLVRGTLGLTPRLVGGWGLSAGEAAVDPSDRGVGEVGPGAEAAGH